MICGEAIDDDIFRGQYSSQCFMATKRSWAFGPKVSPVLVWYKLNGYFMILKKKIRKLFMEMHSLTFLMRGDILFQNQFV